MGGKTPNNKICGLLVSIIPENFVRLGEKALLRKKKKVTANYSEKKVTVVG